jgi:hypothetical protein
MAFKLDKLFSRKNMNLIVSLLTLLIVLWVVMYAIPGLFVNIFYTGLGNLILLIIVLVLLMYNINLGVGVLIVLMILYRFSRMTTYEGLIGGFTTQGLILGGSVPGLIIPVV